MKSLLISKVFPPETGGSGRWFWEIYRRLPREDYRIIAGDSPGASEFDKTHDLDIHRLDLNYKDWGYFSWSGYRRYNKTIKEILELSGDGKKITSIHAGSLLPDGWIAHKIARKFNIPMTLFMHGEETCYANSSRQLRWMSERILDNVHQVVANSLNTKRILTDAWCISPDKIRVLNPGVDCDHFRPTNKCVKTRESLGWNDYKVILTVGRLQKRKGHDTMIRAMPKLKKSIPTVKYAICGDGEERDALEGLVKDLNLEDSVQFIGGVDDETLKKCYQQCDIFVLANRTIGDDIEGFGMVLIEAQACGRPVIAGDSGGTKETLTEGQTGFIVNCDTEDQLCQKIIYLFNNEDELSSMGQKGRELVTSRFDWNLLSRQADSIFNVHSV